MLARLVLPLFFLSCAISLAAVFGSRQVPRSHAATCETPLDLVLVIDGSYSMAYKPTDKSRFQRAKEVAARIVEESPQGDGFTLVLMSAPPRAVVANPVFSPRDFLPEIDKLALLHTTADLPATLAEVEQVLITARREHPRLTREAVYFLTDLGRVGWLVDPADKAKKAEFLERSKRLAESPSRRTSSVWSPGASNR